MSSVKNYTYNIGNVVYSVVTPVYNQEDNVVRNLLSVIENTIENFEIILILDYCYDNTGANVTAFLEKYESTSPYLINISVITNDVMPFFETKCDNIGFKQAVGKYCLEIQADMEMTEYGYNVELTKPFQILDNVIAVSGRCATHLFTQTDSGVGKLGGNIEKTLDELKIERNKFYVMDSCNRGPLLIDRAKLIQLDYLDDIRYFLNDSDHDLMIRAKIKFGYICGYVPIEFKSPLENGSMRNTQAYAGEMHEKNIRHKYLRSQHTRYNLFTHKDTWKSNDLCIYDLPVTD